MQKLPFSIGLILICLSCLSQTMPSSEPDIRVDHPNKASLLISLIADHYQPPAMSIGDPEKYYWPKVMARFEKYGIHDSLGNAWIDALKERSPFHFTMVGMARLMGRYPDAPAMEINRIKLLQKVFERTDSHNPWTSEGTENHINMERTSGYLFAQYALDYPDHFPQAAGKMALMKDWMKKWSVTIYENGTGEWNSGIYQMYHMAGWLNVFDFAADEEVRDIARAVLDYYAAETALHYSWGAHGGSEKRGRGATDMYNTALDYVCWLWFGEDADGVPYTQRGAEYIQSMHAITSSYKPPDAITGMAKKTKDLTDSPAFYKNSKPSYLFGEPSYVKQSYYFNENFTLGSAVSPYGGWTGATSQIVSWKLVARSADGPPFTISGNGRFHDTWSGSKADPFTQVAQHENVLIQMTRKPVDADDIIEKVHTLVNQWKADWQRDFSFRFPADPKPNVVNFAGHVANENRSFVNLPPEAKITFQKQTAFVELGSALLAITFLGMDQPDEGSLKNIGGRNMLIDEAEPGQVCGFILEAVNAAEYGDLDDLIEAFTRVDRIDQSALAETHRVVYRALNGRSIAARYVPDGCFSEALYDWGFGPREPVVVTFEAPWLQPEWPCGDGFGRVPELVVDGVQVDYDKTWPVFSGPHMRLDNRVLTVEWADQAYIVDYTADIPLFRSRSVDRAVHPRGLIPVEEVSVVRERITREPYLTAFNQLQEYALLLESDLPDKLLEPRYLARLAKHQAFLYLLTNESSWAQQAYENLMLVNENSDIISNIVYRGLDRATVLRDMAMTYDFCYHAWDRAAQLDITNLLWQLMVSVASNMGYEANYPLGSNWMGVRYASVMLAAIVWNDPANYSFNPENEEWYSHEAGEPPLTRQRSRSLPFLWDNIKRLEEHVSRNIYPNGWNSESVNYSGYNASFVLPALIALQNHHQGRHFDVETYMPNALNAMWAYAIGFVSIQNNTNTGMQPSTSVDDPRIGSQMFHMALRAYPNEQKPFIKWMREYAFDPNTFKYGGEELFYYLIFDDESVKPMNPASAGWLSYVDDWPGVMLFRNRYQDDQDIVSVFTANSARGEGHKNRDNLTFRIVGLGVPWVIGPGRTGMLEGQTNLFPDMDFADIRRLADKPGVLDTLVSYNDGTYLAKASESCLGTDNHRRTFQVDYAGESGPEAVFIIHDTSLNGYRWRMNTPEFNDVKILDDGFLITGPNGASMKATVLTANRNDFPLHIETTKVRFGGETTRLNPGICYHDHCYENTWAIDIMGLTDLTVVLTLQPKNQPHPQVKKETTGQKILIGDQQMPLK